MDPINVTPVSAPRGQDKIWTLLCHLSVFTPVPLLLPLIVYLAMRGENEYVTANAREALNFHLSLLIYCIASCLLIFIVIGVLLLWAIGLASLILAIVAAIKASEGGVYRYPLTLRLVK